ncbi:hypothetical protein OG365_22875 [Streptomyces sp. NBC_00853]|uniref:hypothetical protein n=1 Tax=Streptomyces sp. NBC_00853 TaxID=2903681 RepID=UPI00387365B9|nr:hypothetical protein OG365_22875 [Streptomyces sp. NBC_00853]
MSRRRLLAAWWFLGAAALFVAVLAAFRADLGGDHEVELAVTDVEGVWQGADGGRLTVRADGSADLERVTRPEPDCGKSVWADGRTYTGPARWVFDTYPDETPGIRFDYQGPATGQACKVYLVVVPHEDGAQGGFLPHVEGQYVRSAGPQG